MTLAAIVCLLVGLFCMFIWLFLFVRLFFVCFVCFVCSFVWLVSRFVVVVLVCFFFSRLSVVLLACSFVNSCLFCCCVRCLLFRYFVYLRFLAWLLPWLLLFSV